MFVLFSVGRSSMGGGHLLIEHAIPLLQPLLTLLLHRQLFLRTRCSKERTRHEISCVQGGSALNVSHLAAAAWRSIRANAAPQRS